MRAASSRVTAQLHQRRFITVVTSLICNSVIRRSTTIRYFTSILEMVSHWTHMDSEEIITVLCCVLTIVLHTSIKRRYRRQLRHTSPPRPKPQRRSFEQVTGHWNSKKFYKNFRMSRAAFGILLHKIRHHISEYNADEGDQTKEVHSHVSRRTTQASTKLAVFLKIMAGSEQEDVANVFGSSTVPVIFGECLEAIAGTLRFHPFPTTMDEFKESAIRFACSRSFNNPLPGCIGALDGIAIALARPRRIYNPSAFYNRKGYYAIPVQAIVDSDCRFMAISVLCVGSTHDSLAFDVSHMSRYIKSGEIPIGLWISSDEAYAGGEFILVPFRQQVLTKFLDGFFYYYYFIYICECDG